MLSCLLSHFIPFMCSIFTIINPIKWIVVRIGTRKADSLSIVKRLLSFFFFFAGINCLTLVVCEFFCTPKPDYTIFGSNLVTFIRSINKSRFVISSSETRRGAKRDRHFIWNLISCLMWKTLSGMSFLMRMVLNIMSFNWINHTCTRQSPADCSHWALLKKCDSIMQLLSHRTMHLVEQPEHAGAVVFRLCFQFSHNIVNRRSENGMLAYALRCQDAFFRKESVLNGCKTICKYVTQAQK